ncbi:hypothetical protein UA08_07731 [Talaromyces atroroseus]|uniref:Hypervirulence associated protein TUDOR domain-containing protein n=1 Tax=Talaromyces atroroseus TaxID=1441469 RepID=A0A225A7S5_TALAT|nr:hypothetical protein UA08_07731 [Talaromyces atroroseus]OKL56741.1 hypothetical protein UA08_07731 [Talaromyces atroroseus]
MAEIRDKHGNTIHRGDHVYTKIRGGRHEGEVEKIVMTQAEAEEEDVKNPPKVLFHDQRGKRVAHNPETLEKGRYHGAKKAKACGMSDLGHIVAGSVTISSYPTESADTWIHMASCGSLTSIMEESLSATDLDKPLTNPVWGGLNPVRFWKAINSALPVPLKKNSVTGWQDKMQARLVELGQKHPMFAVQGYLDDDDEAILSGERTDATADLRSNRMNEVEVAVVSNVKYLLDVDYFSQDGPSEGRQTERSLTSNESV